jgi:type III restriction enzyme
MQLKFDANQEFQLDATKLPDWFKAPTPIGHYNPDWAIVIQDPADPAAERLYLVSKTKGAVERDTLRGAEAKKIECGRVHFEGALGVQYKVVDSAAGLGYTYNKHNKEGQG